MNNKSYFSPAALLPASKRRTNPWNCFAVAALIACLAPLFPKNALAGDAPGWMHAAATATLPPHDEKTDAVAVYSEDITIVLSEGKIKTIERRAYKILRPGGREYGIAYAEFDSNHKITGMKAWCIPAQGKDYEVKQSEAVDVSLAGVESSELVT